MRIFLSHDGEDRGDARALAEGLQACGLEVWCDLLPGRLDDGQPWIAGLERGLRECEGYVILIGRRPLRGWLRAELDCALGRQAREESFPVLPLLAPGVSPEQLGAISPFLERFQAVSLERDPAELSPTAFQGIAAMLASEERGSAALGSEGEHVNPFPGLEVIGEERARFFFGRDREVARLVARLGPTPEGYRRWLQIEGASGAGKSSLARAGLLPAVRRGWIDGRPGAWRIAVLRPGHHPLHNLARELRREVLGAGAQHTVDELEELIRGESQGLVDFAAEHLGPDENLLLLVDQLEEVFTLARWDRDDLDEAVRRDRADFDRLLAGAVTNPDSRVHLITTLRADFKGKLTLLERLARALGTDGHSHLLMPMERAELLQAIRGPARLVGLAWDPPDLPERIADDVLAPGSGEGEGGPGGGLPLLGHALSELWKLRQGRRILGDELTRMQGVGGALAQRADGLLGALDAADRRRARSRITDTSSASTWRRRPRTATTAKKSSLAWRRSCGRAASKS